MSDKVTDSMKSALLWLRNRGGEGVFAERNRMVLLARGDRAGVMRTTWSRLTSSGLVEKDGRRLRLTAAGAAVDLFGVAECDCSERVPGA